MQSLSTYCTAKYWIDTANSCFIQWGLINNGTGQSVNVTLPISVSTIYSIFGNDYNDLNNPAALSFYNLSNNGFTACGRRVNDSMGYKNTFCRWAAICR